MNFNSEIQSQWNTKDGSFHLEKGTLAMDGAQKEGILALLKELG